jgi:hypothetical protein
MNYQRIHDAIIDRARNRTLIGYREKHHVIPRCMNGNNDISNLVELTAREHFIIHKILCEIYPLIDKLIYAYYSMVTRKNKYQDRNYHISNREYQRIKEQHAIRMSNLYTGRFQSPTRKGHINTKEHNQKIANSISALGPRSDETKEKISNSLNGNIPWNKGRIEPREQCIHCNKDYAIKYKTKHICFPIGKY